MADIVESFYGVYLLYNLSERYKGRIYIGFTVDPNRRVSQHNKGSRSGGARKTSNKGPWEMLLIIHGFPNEISALRFEWAWQHPKMSRRLKWISPKKSREKMYDFSMRVLSDMLRIGPWNRLPLTIRWLTDKYIREFPADRLPPVHMPIVYGPVISKKLSEENEVKNDSQVVCNLCFEKILQGDEIKCVNPVCTLKCHITCLSKYFVRGDADQIIPVQGECPSCQTEVLWGDIIRKKNGCYRELKNDQQTNIV